MIKNAFNKQFDLSGKIALVTGASRGIGEAIARRLALAGAHVIISSRKIDACQQVTESIREQGGSAEAFQCHIGNMDDIATIFKHIRDTHGTLDILVNNAAANPYFGHILDTDLRAFDKTVEVNLRGYFYMSVGAGKLMRESSSQKESGGSIINIASVNGVNPGIFQGIYSITKAAVISMTKSFALECASDRIRVNALLPGLTDTKFAGTLINTPAILERALDGIPMKRVAHPDEMAGAVLYLASDMASYTTGSCITVDGGLLVNGL